MMAAIFVLSVDSGLNQVREKQVTIERAEVTGVSFVIVFVMRVLHPTLSLFNRRSKSNHAELAAAIFAGLLIMITVAA